MPILYGAVDLSRLVENVNILRLLFLTAIDYNTLYTGNSYLL